MKKLLVTVNGTRYEVEVEVLQDDTLNPSAPVQQPLPPARTAASPAPVVTHAPAARQRPSVERTNTLTSPINGVLLEIPVKIGQEVKENEVLFVLEAMKMKTTISSPQAGTVKEILVAVGDTVEAGRPLLTFA